MEGINLGAVVVAGLAGFIFSSIYYIVFGKTRAKLSSAGNADLAALKRPQPLKMLVEIVRTIILSLVVAYFVKNLQINDWTKALQLGFILWFGFPFILLTGSILWEKVPTKLAAIHAGDWLVKLLLLVTIISSWR